MRSSLTTTALLLRSRMLLSLSKLQPPLDSPFSQVLLSFSFYIYNLQFNTNLNQLSPKQNGPHSNLSSINFSSIDNKVIRKYPHHRDEKNGSFSKPSLKDCIFRLSTVYPEIIRKFRKFRRASGIKPKDVLEILVGFEPRCDKIEIEVEKIKSLWELFNLARENDRGFEHLPKSYELMADMLVRVGLLREVENLLSTMDSKGISLDSDKFFSNLVIGYVKEGEFQKAISVYNELRTKGIVPSVICYRVLINFLIAKGDSKLSLRIYIDMVDMGLGLYEDDLVFFENVVLLLCRDGKVEEARKLVRRVALLGIRLSDVVLDEITSRYCEKKDYDGLLKLFVETRCTINVLVGNKVIHSLCDNFGVEKASFFLQEMENISFVPNEVTYGILIGWSCREHKLKNAFIYLSECLSRSLKPHVRTYNALICGVFNKGMWKYAQDILSEMYDRGVVPSSETFKVLLAGYSKARKFDKVKELIEEMAGRGFIRLSFVDDPLSNAFALLGLDPLSVKVRRDNDVALFKTEFFDKIGNGLYLETDKSKFEKIVNEVLEESLVPDFNSLIMENCAKGNFRSAIVNLEKMVKWGQELSFSAYKDLVKGLCTSRLSMKMVVILVEKRPNFAYQLDRETLNLLVQALSEKRFLDNAATIFEGMCKKNLEIDSETYDALVISLCQKRNLTRLRTLISCLCSIGNIEKALDLSKEIELRGLNNLEEEVPDNINYDDVVKQLCRDEKVNKAIDLLNIMLKKVNIPSSSTYDGLIECSCKCLKLDQALDLIYEMLDMNLKPSVKTWDLIIHHACQNGPTVEGERLLGLMVEIGGKPTREIYCSLIDRFYYEKNLQKASEYLQIMQQNGHEPDFGTHWSLISNLKNKNDSRKRRSFLSRLLSDSGFRAK